MYQKDNYIYIQHTSFSTTIDLKYTHHGTQMVKDKWLVLENLEMHFSLCSTLIYTLQRVRGKYLYGMDISVHYQRKNKTHIFIYLYGVGKKFTIYISQAHQNENLMRDHNLHVLLDNIKHTTK